MRVLHVAAGNLFGGVERILVEIAAHAPRDRHAFALCFDGRLSRELEARGVRPAIIGPAAFSNPLSIWRARRRLRRIAASGFDTVVCHAPWSYALAAAALGDIPALWAHDGFAGDHWTERRVLKRPPALVICNSKYTQSTIAARLPEARCRVVYAPVSVPPAAPNRLDTRRALDTDASSVVIVIASRLERWKGHAELLRAVTGVDGDWTLWIAGGAQRPHERTYARELKQLAVTLDIASRVRFLEERSDVPALFAAADIHCQPNTKAEPFGIAFVEALYARLPVVTTDAGGAREIVTPDCGVLVPPGDRDALRSALQRLVSEPERRASLSAAGPGRARQLCDPLTQVSCLEMALSEASAAA